MIVATIIVIIYTLALLMVFAYALSQLNLLLNYISYKRKNIVNELIFNPKSAPRVTIQLPIYNEKYVVNRLIDHVVQLNYPNDRLEIQVLDDSTDETVQILKTKVHEWQQRGIDIKHITRQIRTGFKAGALKEGLATAKGEFIVIFDADFLPEEDWLQKTIPHFDSPNIGVIQTRWGHENRDYSLLTKVQAFALDAHFTIEQVGRNSKGHFINFNGTAGVWRKECILDAGNWQQDTLTEDLDLSYRAQLKGWKFKFLEDVVTTAELPIAVSAARSQQFRWNKGAAENFKKNFKKVLFNKELSKSSKIHAFFHLLNSTMFVNVFVIAVLSIPLMLIKNKYPEFNFVYDLLGFFLLSTVFFFIYYWNAYKQIYGRGWKQFIRFIPAFLTFFTIAIGFSWNNTKAVTEAYIGKTSDFIRTPKFNLKNNEKAWRLNKYLVADITFDSVVEGILFLYFSYGIYLVFTINPLQIDWGMFLFMLMLFLGFGFVFINSILKR
ncbi:MAG: glycosyltransferase [Flavobacteriales bacterium]|jgi:cellulose synthase/poly-beta-1,6-N-acetylglucosamine synthase-like glycosyltransferase|nr:glycosyltransferase [Flavobacteriales bacterium]